MDAGTTLGLAGKKGAVPATPGRLQCPNGTRDVPENSGSAHGPPRTPPEHHSVERPTGPTVQNA